MGRIARYHLWVCWLICLAGMLPGALSGAGGPTAAAVFKDIPYSGATKGDRRRSFDLYLPPKASAKPPLLIFVHGGFWLLSDDEYRIGPSIAENLVRDGVAVALLRYRLAPAYRHPAQAEDVAPGVAHLIKNAEKYGFDGKRIFLAGHSAGGHLASLVALDARYLNHHGATLNPLAGIISISGLYDLAPTWDVSQNQKSATASAFGKDPAVLKSASPIQYVHAGAPPFFILSAFRDFPGLALDARRFADALRKAGNQKIDQVMLKGADHFTSVKLDDENHPVRRAILGFMGVKPAPPELAEWIAAKRRWTSPPHSTLPFWQHHKLVRSYPVDEGLRDRLRFVFRHREEELLEWPLKRYHAIDLFAYLDALPKERVGEGDYIILTNIRGEQQVWKRDQIERFKPVIVIGVDEERNLFRFSSFYRMYHEYSWKPGDATPTLALTLGAFIHFREKPLPELAAQSWHFGLTDDSFRRSKTDPLKAVRDVPRDVEEALTFRNGCVYCHSFRGIGAASHHVNAMTGKPQGGFALTLESYPPEVWKTFMFDQETVAKKMGATPNIVRDSVRQPLFELVNQSRRQQAQPNQ